MNNGCECSNNILTCSPDGKIPAKQVHTNSIWSLFVHEPWCQTQPTFFSKKSNKTLVKRPTKPKSINGNPLKKEPFKTFTTFLSDGENLSQATLDSAAARNIGETAQAVQASLGLVNDTIFDVHSSGNTEMSASQ